MLLALAASLTAQAGPLSDSFLEPPALSESFTLAEPVLEYSALPAVSRDTYGEGGWMLTGLSLLGGGAAVMVVSGAAMSATESDALDTIFSCFGLFGAVHFVVGASMLGLELTEGDGARVFFTGTGLSGRF